ncbi:MAG: hypothetical protein WCS37_20230 [Chloroflexota bacterium]
MNAVGDFATAAGFDGFDFYSAEMQEYVEISITVEMPAYISHER